MKQTLIALVLITLILMLSACKKHKAPEEEVVEVEKQDENPLKKRYLPIKLESSSFSFSLKYKEGTNLLSEIIGSDGNRALITYTSAQIPLKLESYHNTTLLKLIDYYKDGKQRIKQCTSFNYDANNRSYLHLGDINIDYDGKDQINNLKFINNLNKLTWEMTIAYNTEGNISSTQLKDENAGNNTFSYTYDKQMGIYQQVPYTALFAIALDSFFLNCSNNNVLTFSDQKNTVENALYSYEYNLDGYPISIKMSKNKTTQTFKISYTELIN